MSLFEDVNEVGILSVGRNPSWSSQASYDGKPTSAADGVATSASGSPARGTVSSMMFLRLWENAGYRTGRMEITNHVGGSIYAILVNGIAVLYVSLPGDTIADVMAGLVAALVGVPAADALVSFTAEESVAGGGIDRLLITGDSSTSFGMQANASGAATAEIEADADTCTARLFAMMGPVGGGSSNPSGWVQPDDGEWSVSDRGLVERLNVAGLLRMYLQLLNVAGHILDGGTITYNPVIQFGIAQLESS